MELDRITEFKFEKEIEQEILYSAIEDELDKEIKIAPRSSEVKKRKKRKLRFKKEIKVRTLLLLIVTLIMNTYAWFIYIATISVGLDVHIKSWDFELENGTLSQDFDFFVENIYPGVPIEDTVQTINATNNGDMDAVITCDVVYMKILDKEYSTSQSFTTNALTQLYTPDELLEKLYEDYPFKIKIYLTMEDSDGNKNTILYEGQEIEMSTSVKTEIKLQIEWPYEVDETTLNTIGKTLEETDEIDTQWGEAAYRYHKDNPDEYSIVVKINIQAVQKETGTP